MKNLFLLFVLVLFFISFEKIYAQNVAINNNGAAPNVSAILDINAPNKGVLFPRVTLFGTDDAGTVPTPATGLIIYNAGGILPAGLYCNEGTPAAPAWAKMKSGNTTDWSPNGNNITSNQFIGTTNTQSLRFKVNNQPYGALFTSGNISFGLNGLLNLINGSYNIALGSNSLKMLTSGNYNIAIGNQSLTNNNADENTAIGYQSMTTNTSGYGNTGVGSNSMNFNTTGYENTATGKYSLYHNTDGTQNTAIGAYALNFNSHGQINTAIGVNSMYNNNTGNSNTAIGSGSLYSNIGGSGNVAVGVNSLRFNTGGEYNLALGINAMYINNQGTNNIALGTNCVRENTTGSYNIGIGRDALYRNTTKNDNIAIGDSVLRENGLNVFATEHASKNVGLGSRALLSNTYGYGNIAVGYRAMLTNTTGYHNLGVGYAALSLNSVGYNNVAVGDSAMYTNVNGHDNAAFGQGALYKNTSGINNAAFGPGALYKNTSGINNVGVGPDALFNTSAGTGNVGIGYESGKTNTIGDKNTFIGYQANVQYNNLEYATAIGAGAVTNCSNCMALGGTGAAAAFVGLNTVLPVADLHLKQKVDSYNTTRGFRMERSSGGHWWQLYVDSGNAFCFEFDSGAGQGNYAYIDTDGSFHNGSDRRLKKDIAPLDSMLSKVMRLEPVTYHYLANNSDRPFHYGFIAQDVQSIFPDVVQAREDGMLTIAYAEFTSIAIKAIQEQQIQIETLQSENHELMNRLQQLENAVAELQMKSK